MALMLSFQHYNWTQLYWEFYWNCYGVIVWLCDACAYISIYIAVCFTIERFIAIRYPLKRQTFCTETLAKRVIIGVTLFCILSTISTAFEHDNTINYRSFDENGRPCNMTNDTSSFSNESTALENNWKTQDIPNHDSSLSPFSTPDYRYNSDFEIIPENPDNTNQGLSSCKTEHYFKIIASSLGKNSVYKDIWYLFTLIVFVLIPLCLLGTFNCFLIMLVRRSKNLRGEMTNANSMRRTKKGKSRNSSVSQENRVTVTLIAVVLLFIICQLPWAVYSIVDLNVTIEKNLQTIIGNVFNFLAAINAAANFFLYCVLSDKYRKTVRKMILGYKYHAQRSQPSFYSSSLTANGSSQRRQHVSSSPAPLFIK